MLKWSRSRGRYERQGLLVDEKALRAAEAACEDDAPTRAARAARRAEQAAVADQSYIERFAEKVRQRYPACPAGRARDIAEHACRKYSDRIGRSAAAKSFDAEAIDLAVRARIRHTETPYDELLMRGDDRDEARRSIAELVDAVAIRWSG